jgi:hypothetical protein
MVMGDNPESSELPQSAAHPNRTLIWIRQTRHRRESVGETGNCQCTRLHLPAVLFAEEHVPIVVVHLPSVVGEVLPEA